MSSRRVLAASQQSCGTKKKKKFSRASKERQEIHDRSIPLPILASSLAVSAVPIRIVIKTAGPVSAVWKPCWACRLSGYARLAHRRRLRLGRSRRQARVHWRRLHHCGLAKPKRAKESTSSTFSTGAATDMVATESLQSDLMSQFSPISASPRCCQKAGKRSPELAANLGPRTLWIESKETGSGGSKIK